MSYWMCCNSCFLSPSAERKLAITTCGHVICSVCYQRGKQGECLICNAKCQVSPLSQNSSSEVKSLFSNIDVVANKHFADIKKVIMFQAAHQKSLLTHYQKRNEKLEESFVKMKQEMQQMTKKLTEQRAYITQLESSLQQKSGRVSSVPQMSRGSRSPHGHKSVLQIPYNSPMSLSRHSSTTNVNENMEVEERSLFRKPNTAPRVSLMSPLQYGQMGTISHRSSSQNTLTSHSAHSNTIRSFPRTSVTPDISYGQSSGWKTPILKPLSSFRHSMSSLAFGPQLPLIGIDRMRKEHSGGERLYESFMVTDSIHLSHPFTVKRQLPVKSSLDSFSSSPTTAAVDSSTQESPPCVHTLFNQPTAHQNPL